MVKQIRMIAVEAILFTAIALLLYGMAVVITAAARAAEPPAIPPTAQIAADQTGDCDQCQVPRLYTTTGEQSAHCDQCRRHPIARITRAAWTLSHPWRLLGRCRRCR